MKADRTPQAISGNAENATKLNPTQANQTSLTAPERHAYARTNKSQTFANYTVRGGGSMTELTRSGKEFQEWLGSETCPVHYDNSAEKNAEYGWQAGRSSLESENAAANKKHLEIILSMQGEIDEAESENERLREQLEDAQAEIERLRGPIE